ncbi:general secretion pathway protein GspK [methanotrophic endosymbiont of Bathymodiolus puteoserpentis (Logatchev)]|jgi:general secretion pathway protein K|uniref:general secretion pathway protein GspK n=1 Tax=methanotrophic endosymbiont of Bathymodiolus puteoserpentis (Logatchev) TaxID=343235 RepID=UPI0013C5F495|nr:type II secretion system protein GspK [methanotrophic endosymbiont of Bathymodiolus puteoserpentis (Logatchev)]SHE21355.1 General secretion pathway protein K [methanotrophic endosymbiont of Bathymodiolus puteoserpentis (Logatchev)]
MKSNKGLALIVVLWVITLLTIMASSFALTIQRESAIISGIKEKAEAQALAEAGINYAVVMLFNTNAEQQWQSTNSLYEVNYAGKNIRILIADESGKVNINYADKQQLLDLLNFAQVEEAQADSLSDAIIDWRDKDDLIGLNGAEEQQYKDAGLKYRPRNNLFNSVEELQMVLGMTPKIYQQIEDMISVYTKKAAINPATASRSVLLTLPDATEALVDEYMQQRAENQRNKQAVVAPDWYNSATATSNVYMIISEAMIERGSTAATMAVIRKGQAKNGLPFQILKWVKDYSVRSLFLPENDQWIINSDV